MQQRRHDGTTSAEAMPLPVAVAAIAAIDRPARANRLDWKRVEADDRSIADDRRRARSGQR